MSYAYHGVLSSIERRIKSISAYLPPSAELPLPTATRTPAWDVAQPWEDHCRGPQRFSDAGVHIAQQRHKALTNVLRRYSIRNIQQGPAERPGAKECNDHRLCSEHARGSLNAKDPQSYNVADVGVVLK